jgi:diguanylate cyclase (GGDEF)-like protein
LAIDDWNRRSDFDGGLIRQCDRRGVGRLYLRRECELMEMVNLWLFVAEAVLYFVIMTAFLHYRYRLGLGVFLTALGVMHFMETYLAAIFYVALPFGVVSPGSSVFFAGKLMMILLLYLKEDAATVRQPIYGLFLGNLLTVVVAQLLQLHYTTDLVTGRAVDLAFLQEMGWLMIVGTTLLYLDAIGIILLYERLGKYMPRRVVLRFLISGAVMLTFDQLGFYTALYYAFGAPIAVFWGGWQAKMLALGIYTVLFAVYQTLLRNKGASTSRRDLADIFNDLTFRERYEDLLARSGRDMLTGIFDRSRMEIDVPKTLRDKLARQQAVSLIILDADSFKSINDLFGHLQGDAVLRELALRLQQDLRPTDQLFRYGGEEFVVVLPQTGHEQGMVLAERLRQKISTAIQRPDGQPMTISLGIATAPEDGSDLNALLSMADKRLYLAKNAGRDRVVGREA